MRTLLLAFLVATLPSISVAGILGGEFPLENSLSSPHRAHGVAMAHDVNSNRFLVVWSADRDVDGVHRIFAQVFHGQTGLPTTAVIPISGADTTNPAWDEFDPAVTYGEGTEEFLIAWSSDQFDSEAFEIHARKIDSTGAFQSPMNLVTAVGNPPASPQFDALRPSVAYDPISASYVVTFVADDSLQGAADGEFHVWAQGLDENNLAWWQYPAIHLGPQTPGAGPEYDADRPFVAHSPTVGMMAVFYEAEPVPNPGAHYPEIYGQLFDSFGNSFPPIQISQMGPSAVDLQVAHDPVAAWSDAAAGFLVAWSGNELAPPDHGRWIHGTLVDGGLTPSGSQLPLLGTGTNSPAYRGHHPTVAWSEASQCFMVFGVVNTFAQPDEEIWGQEFDSALVPKLASQVRLTQTGPDFDLTYLVEDPDVASGDFNNIEFVGFTGRDVPADGEIWGFGYAAQDILTAAPDLPTEYALHEPHPNPFNPSTNIDYEVPVDGARVQLEIFDSRGRRVRTLRDTATGAGLHSQNWNGQDDQGRAVRSGVYHLRMRADGREIGRVNLTLVR